MVPVFYLIGSVLVRATAKKVIQELAKRGAQKIPASQAVKMKESPINVTMKNLDKIVKSPALKNIKPTTKPKVTTPKKTTTTQKTTGPAKPRVTSSNVKDALKKPKLNQSQLNQYWLKNQQLKKYWLKNQKKRSN